MTAHPNEALIERALRQAHDDSHSFGVGSAEYWRRLSAAVLRDTTASATAGEAFQQRVAPWMQACFGPEISADVVERCDRLIEEAFELVQSLGYDPCRIMSLASYVFNRPVGEPSQEVGGVMVTLAALCLATGLDMHEAAETELARIWTKVETIRAKQAAKPTGSALPVAPGVPADDGLRLALERLVEANTRRALYGGKHLPSLRQQQDAMKVARQALAASPSTPVAAAGEAWQPIETAPKDGTAIVAWCVHPYASSMTQPDDYVGPVVTRWIDHNGGGWTWHGHLGKFTHWMPLPAAPALARPAPSSEGE